MKILCEYLPKYSLRTVGVGRVMWKLGHEFIHWNPSEKPAFDAFDEIEPDIFLCSGETMTFRAVAKCLSEREGNGPKCISLADVTPAADTLAPGGERRPSLACQVGYIGDYVPEIHNTYLLPLCHESARLRVKICGAKPWPVVQYLGPIRDDTVPDFHASAKVSLNFSGEELAYQILVAGGLPASRKFDGSPFDETSCLMADSPSALRQIVDVFAPGKAAVLKARDAMREKGMAVVRDGNTYWHRVSKIFRDAGCDREAERTMRVYESTFPV